MKKIAGIPEDELKKIKEEIHEIKVATFEHLRYIVDGDVDLKSCGYKSLEDATIKLIKGASKTIENLLQQIERKYK